MDVEDRAKAADSQDPVYNMALPASRLQQAARVRNTLQVMQSAVSKAKLRRTFRRYPNKIVRQLAKDYPMYELYQIRALALHDKTYAGSIGIIASYLENGGVTFMVLYDRPGHLYSDARNRHMLDPKWIEKMTLEEFEKVVEKDNPTVVLA